MTLDQPPGLATVRYLVVIVLLAGLLIVMAIAYGRQTAAIRDACSATSAAAKLDLSGMVPICKDYKERP